MDTVRSMSLRKKRSVRPKISAPKQISSPIPAGQERPTPTKTSVGQTFEPLPERPRLAENKSASTLSVATQNTQRRPSTAPKENTEDYVKRRYSTRFNQNTRIDLDAPPPIPTVNAKYSPKPSQDVRRPSNVGGSRVAVDHGALEDPNLRPEQYIMQILTDASETDIREYQHELSRLKNNTSTDIQHNVFQNRNQFIKISQEAEKLKTEMRTLRNLMSDLTSTLGQTNAALGINTETSSGRKFANRSSVANLEAMWSSHMQELWRRVEGSQKYLPAIPGRHVVHESGIWVELNIATWKPRRRVHVILLNDHLLVATEKKRVDTSPNPDNSKGRTPQSHPQFVVEHCWPLQDIEVSELGNKLAPTPGVNSRRISKSGISNAISVRSGSDSFTYAAVDSEGAEKASFLSKFRKTQIELRKALSVEVDDRPSNGTKPSAAPANHDNAKPLRPNSETAVSSANKANMLIDVGGRQQTFRWVETQVDELDIDIALQRFEAAVSRTTQLRSIAKSNKNNAAVQELVDGKVAERGAKLAKALVRQLVDKNSFMSATQEHVGWLTKLGFEARASEAYLEARGDVIRLRTSQCVDQGDLHHYLYQLSYIYFTLIRNTVQIYQACFATNMGSACIKWAKEQVDAFNEILLQQLGKLDPKSEERRYCLERAQEQAAVLAEVGIDFRNLVGRGLVEK